MVFLMSTLGAMGTFFHSLWSLIKKKEYRAGLLWLGLLLLMGMIFYRQVEGWEWLDALYFSVVTLSTVGYGDMSPTTPISKIFTMVYILMGLSIFASFAGMLVKERGERHKERASKVQEKKAIKKDD